jgi:hypothetical protein
MIILVAESVLVAPEVQYFSGDWDHALDFEATTPFDINKPLYRLGIWKDPNSPPNEPPTRLILGAHHALLDGVGLANYLAHFSDLSSDQTIEKKAQIESVPMEFETLPLDLPRGTWTPQPQLGSRHSFTIEAQRINRLKALSKEFGVTLFHLCIGLKARYVARQLKTDFVTFAVPFAARETVAQWQRLSNEVKIVPLTLRISEHQSLKELALHARSVVSKGHEICRCSEGQNPQSAGSTDCGRDFGSVRMTFNFEPARAIPDFFGSSAKLLATKSAAAEFPWMCNITLLSDESGFSARVDWDFQKDAAEIELFSEQTFLQSLDDL